MDKLAIHGGTSASEKRIQIAKPVFDEKTIQDVEAVIRSGYLRQGPKTKLFEDNFAEKVGSKYAYAVYTGTAALHVTYLSVVEPGDEIIVPSFTFFATASMALHSNAKPVFADIDPKTFIIDTEDMKEKIQSVIDRIEGIHIPQDIVLYGRAISLLSGVIAGLDSHVNGILVAKPMIMEALMRPENFAPLEEDEGAEPQAAAVA